MSSPTLVYTQENLLKKKNKFPNAMNSSSYYRNVEEEGLNSMKVHYPTYLHKKYT